MPYEVEAVWDPVTARWSADSSDVLGLVVEDETLEGLIVMVMRLVPGLLLRSGEAIDPNVQVNVTARKRDEPVTFSA